ncbi:MAG: tripartite tricarboxylate transporter TctB family protein [Pseudolabrys sp.]|nr:tripartite tricarboxylate transporter TctB family protein [Pseudolabrys sp.]
MTLRADHVAGAAFVVFGIAILALSGDLPTGQLSMPGSGFMPKIIAVLLIVLGAVLALRGKESGPMSELGWEDAKHALLVVTITAIGIALYTELGFIITLIAMTCGLLIIVERRNPFRALAYSAAVVLTTYVSFEYLLKTPLPLGPFGF